MEIHIHELHLIDFYRTTGMHFKLQLRISEALTKAWIYSGVINASSVLPLCLCHSLVRDDRWASAAVVLLKHTPARLNKSSKIQKINKKSRKISALFKAAGKSEKLND